MVRRWNGQALGCGFGGGQARYDPLEHLATGELVNVVAQVALNETKPFPVEQT